MIGFFIQDELHLSAPRKSQSFPQTDIITGTHSPLLSSSSDVLGPLNFSSAPLSSSSHTSIPSIDFTSFTTDNFQQPWLPTPPPTQPSASSLNNSNNNNNNSALEDFVLYPAPQPRQQPRFRDSRSLAPNTALRPSALQPFLAQNNPRRHSFSLQLQRHLQQQFPGSPVQDPRVTQLARSPSYWSHPTVKHSQPYSATVPTNSPQRPPVPPFYSGNITPENRKQYMQYRRNMSTPNFQGTSFGSVLHPRANAHTAPAHDSELFGLPSAGGMGSLTFDELLGQETGPLSPEAPAGTISPRDLMFDHSIPPSGTFTDLSTPPFDSPGTFSQNPSPLFTDVDYMGNDDWAPLFHDGAIGNPTASGLFDVSEYASVIAEPKKQMQPSIEMSPAPKPLSPAVKSSPMSATGKTRHSSVAGITRQRKDLSPIEFDPLDPIATKRARNTEAARKSRAKKLARQASAESRIQALEDQLTQRDEMIAKLQAQLAVLQANQ
ncbi:hypothetical protein N7520_001273 [Penicillium odoratum]|uniref:uncharacterized protein n=1 Tax=Penicillium odoratum TaxID=1167516 RepID=UPI0025488621|nr:uncharacterized protein N7520_001273 [Penicillium odoratum]KAJ5778027.1 hypothetical protein N7520_001273 [Penicillium odoratum]